METSSVVSAPDPRPPENNTTFRRGRPAVCAGTSLIIAGVPAHVANIAVRESPLSEIHLENMLKLSRMGVDGLLLSWVDYLGECRQWIDEVLPLMEQAGQRRPVDR